MITGMGLSLKGMSGTGAGQEAAEISFDLADAGESEQAEDHPTVTPPPEEAKPPTDAPASVAQKTRNETACKYRRTTENYRYRTTSIG